MIINSSKRNTRNKLENTRLQSRPSYLAAKGTSGMATKTPEDHRAKRICTGHSVSCVTNTNDYSELFEPDPVSKSHRPGRLLSIEKPAYDLTILDEINTHGLSCKKKSAKKNSASSLMDSDQSAHGWTIVDDMEQHGDSCKDVSASALVDTAESVHGSNKLSPEESGICNATSMHADDDSIDSAESSSSLDNCDSELERALRLVSSDVPSAHSSSNTNSKAQEILRLLFSDGEYNEKSVPVGPGFQAAIPEWTCPVDRKKLYGTDGSKTSKWLGTQMWPIKRSRKAGTNTETIGKGRPDSCSCVSPGSFDCVKHHIDETRVRLQAEIGPAFWNWKFDEMGEFASKSWTLKEQSAFESLVRRNPLASEEGFWELAFKRFPNKTGKCVVSYYFNVLINRRMSLQTRSRSSLDEVDSDEE